MVSMRSEEYAAEASICTHSHPVERQGDQGPGMGKSSCYANRLDLGKEKELPNRSSFFMGVSRGI